MTTTRSVSQTQHAVEPSRKELNINDIHDPEFNVNVKESLMNDNLTDEVQAFIAYLAKAAELQNPENMDLQTHDLPGQPPVVRVTTVSGPSLFSGCVTC